MTAHLPVLKRHPYRCRWFDCLQAPVNWVVSGEKRHLLEFALFDCVPRWVSPSYVNPQSRLRWSLQCDSPALRAFSTYQRWTELVVEFFPVDFHPDSIVSTSWANDTIIFVESASLHIWISIVMSALTFPILGTLQAQRWWYGSHKESKSPACLSPRKTCCEWP